MDGFGKAKSPEGSHRGEKLSPFSFLDGADETIVNIVHNAILAAELRVVVKDQVIFDCLSEERQNEYWSWKMQISRQVPEEVLQHLSENSGEAVVNYVQQNRLDKAFIVCSSKSHEAEQLLRKWAEKVKHKSEEWLEVVFDYAAKIITKWSQKQENNREMKHITHVNVGSSSNNMTTSTPPAEKEFEECTNSVKPTKEYNPRVEDIDEVQNRNQPPVASVRTKKMPQYTVNGDEDDSATRGSDNNEPENSFKKSSRSECPDCKPKQDTNSDSPASSVNKDKNDPDKKKLVSLVTDRPPPSFTPAKVYGNQIPLGTVRKECMAQFGMSIPPPGTTFEMTTTTYRVVVPEVPRRRSTNSQAVVPIEPATVQEIDNDIGDVIRSPKNQNDPINQKPIPLQSEDVNKQWLLQDTPSSSTPEYKKFHELKALNILLLGETGVGKTTFVNSLANYLKYKTLEEALSGKPIILVDASFVQGFENGESTTVHVTSNSGANKDTIKQNEHLNDAGASCTQSTVEHVFTWNDGGENKLVRIIDTPGINDTRGAEKDKENLNDIMKHVSQIGKLHAICILMKPNEAKLNHSFRSCIDHLLKSLHRSATTNILFCFTMTRSNMYRPGDSLATLRAYLDKLERDTGVLIRADSSNLFSFENDCFRYMCAVKQLPQLDTSFNMKTFSEGWKHNVPECIKMFKRVEGLAPHSVEDTVSVNATRRLIERIVKPLADVARNHIVNMKLLHEFLESVANPSLEGDYLAAQVYQEQITMVPKLLAFPRTVCNAPCCVEYIQVNKYQAQTVHKQICHDRCRTTSVEEKRKSDKDVEYCIIFHKRHGLCEVCGCHWKYHSHEIYELKYETKMVEDVSAKMKVDDYVNRKKMKELQLRDQKQKLLDMQQENDQIRDCCVEMAAFLQKNSMKQGCDPYFEHLRQLVEEEENKVELGHASFEMALELVNLQDSYKKRVEYVIKEIDSRRRSVLTTAQLNSMIDSLAQMKYAGSTFACLRDYQMSADANVPQTTQNALPDDRIRDTRENAQPSHSGTQFTSKLYPGLQ